MPNQPRLKVIKVPLDYEPDFKSVNFPPMPRLYLEFFENKNKVKPELRNKEYIPKLGNLTNINLPSLQDATEYASKQNDTMSATIEDKREKTTPRISRDNNVNIENKESRENNSRSGAKKLQILDISKMSENDIQELTQKKRIEKRENLFRYKKKSGFQEYSNEEEPEKNTNISDDDIGYKEYKEEQKDNINSINSENFDIQKHEIKSESMSKSGNEDDDKTDTNLLNLLKGNKPIEQKPVIVEPTVNTTKPIIPNLPPSISEINSGKVSSSQYRDLTNAVVNEDEVVRKRKILSDFKRIKKMDPNASIPEFTELTDLNTLEREYANVVKNLHIDSNVENYKKWLTMGFIGLEWVLSNWMKFEEIKGFSAAQMTSMNQYERILIEIGEKSYVPEEKRLAPEIRLIGIILMNAATFIGMKMLFKSTGMSGGINLGGNESSSSNPMEGLGGLFSNLSSSATASSKPKKRMPGPDINLDDLSFKKNE